MSRAIFGCVGDLGSWELASAQVCDNVGPWSDLLTT